MKVDKQLNQFTYLKINFEMFLINQYINIILTFLIIKISSFILILKLIIRFQTLI